MKARTGSVALVTGASSGIGEASARALAAAGLTVYAAARRVERMQHLAAHRIQPIALDVTDDESARACVETIEREAGQVDVLVNNAGYGSYGAVEDVPISEAERQFQVNVFGVARMIKLVLPGMRERRHGRIINISSMGGKIYTPFGGWYHATKFALEGMSDCLRLEVAPFGVDVVVVEPGGIKTDWGMIAADNLEQESGSGPYAATASKTADGMRTMYSGDRLSGPSVVADAIVAAATAKKPRTRYAVGYGAKPLIAARTALPDRAFDALIRRASF